MLYILASFFLGVLVALVFSQRLREKAVGICATALDRTVRKQANLDKIMALFAKNQELSNADIREALGVSRQSVVNYMDELEKEGKIEQAGDTGRGVVYRAKG